MVQKILCLKTVDIFEEESSERIIIKQIFIIMKRLKFHFFTIIINGKLEGRSSMLLVQMVMMDLSYVNKRYEDSERC